MTPFPHGWLCVLVLRTLLQVVLTAAIAITIFSGYMYYRFEDTVDPVYTGVDDEKKRAEALAGK